MVISSSSNNDFSSSLRYRDEFQKDNIGVTNSKSKLFYLFNFMVLIKHVFFYQLTFFWGKEKNFLNKVCNLIYKSTAG